MSANEWVAVLERLRRELPPFGAPDDPDEAIRSALRPLVERARVTENVPLPEDPLTCPNCGSPTSSERSPYCGTKCREMAAFIRQFRACMMDGSVFDIERQKGLGQALWSVQGGGFPRRQLMIEPKIVAKVIAKQGGVCAQCGAPATEVDHVGSACNRTSNLRAVCANCNRAKGFGDANYGFSEAYKECARRVGSYIPLHPCDDPAGWDWRAYLARRKAALLDR